MSQLRAAYSIGDDLDDLAVFWQATSGAYRDFSTGWSFEIKVGNANGVNFTTANVTGQVGSSTVPSLVVAWAAGTLDTITAVGDYYVQVRCTRSVDSKKLTKRGVLTMKPSS